jgi:hypothetical protein
MILLKITLEKPRGSTQQAVTEICTNNGILIIFKASYFIT